MILYVQHLQHSSQMKTHCHSSFFLSLCLGLSLSPSCFDSSFLSLYFCLSVPSLSDGISLEVGPGQSVSLSQRTVPEPLPDSDPPVANLSLTLGALLQAGLAGSLGPLGSLASAPRPKTSAPRPATPSDQGLAPVSPGLWYVTCLSLTQRGKTLNL